VNTLYLLSRYVNKSMRAFIEEIVGVHFLGMGYKYLI
jgi:hypothetical protein